MEEIKEIISDRIVKCCSRAYGFGMHNQIENLNNEEKQTIEYITNFVYKIIQQNEK